MENSDTFWTFRIIPLNIEYHPYKYLFVFVYVLKCELKIEVSKKCFSLEMYFCYPVRWEMVDPPVG